MGPNGKLVVVNFCQAVFGRTVGAGGFNGVIEFTEEKISKCGALRKFAALIRTYTAAVDMSVLGQECSDDVDWRLFGGGKEYPSHARCLINHKEIGAITVVRPNNAIL
jgi:hypothetical protein